MILQTVVKIHYLFFPNPTLHYVVREANTVAHDLPELHVQFTIEKKKEKNLKNKTNLMNNSNHM